MKKVFLLMVLFILFSKLNANCQTFNNGSNVADISFGFGSTLMPSGNTLSFAPICLTFDHGILDNIIDKGCFGVGGLLGYSGSDYSGSYNSTYNVSNITIGARGTFHYSFLDKLDTYGGILIGFNIVSSTSTGNSVVPTSGPVTGIFVGGRYYFTNNIASFAELGYDIAYLKIGISFKFN